MKAINRTAGAVPQPGNSAFCTVFLSIHCYVSAQIMD